MLSNTVKLKPQRLYRKLGSRKLLTFPLLLLLIASPLIGVLSLSATTVQGQAQNASGGLPSTVGPVTFSVTGASLVGANVSGQDDGHDYSYIFVADSTPSIEIQASAAANPLCCSASYGGVSSSLSIQIVASDGENATAETSDNGTAISTSASLHPTGADVTVVSSTIEFDAFCGSLRGCPAPWDVVNCYESCPLYISVYVLIRPSITLSSNVGSVDPPGDVSLSGSVVPALGSLSLMAYKDGVLNYTDTINPDANGRFTYGASFGDSSYFGAWNYTVTASNGCCGLPTSQFFNASASVIVTVGSTTTTTTTTSTQHKAMPIIIIPGIGGSELQSSTSGGECGLIGCHEVWPIPFTIGYHLSDLGLNSDGTQPSGMFIHATDILQTGVPDVNFYGPLVDSLVNHGYVLGKSLFVFPYDWRLDNNVHLGELDSLVNQARAANDSQQVILVAHSMGGLIATAYVNSSPARAAKVDSIITMGTPFFGSPKVYYGLTEGYALDNGLANIKAFMEMMQNWPGVYQLLPKVPFIQTGTGDLSLGATFGITYNSAYGYDTWNLNPDMLANMTAFNSLIGTPDHPVFPSSVKLYTIIGYETDTLTGYRISAPTQEELADKMYVTLNGAKVVLIPIFGDGDGTVPLWGAENPAATAKYYVSPNDGGGPASHGALPKNSIVEDIVWSIVSGSPANPTGYRYPTSTTIASDDSTDFTIHSNANLQIIDQSGNVLGWNGGNGTISEDVTGGTFIDQDGVQYAAIMGTPVPYRVLVNGTSVGTFQLSINETSGGRTTNIAYPEVPVANATVSELSFDPSALTSSSGPALSVTTNGNTASYLPTSVSQLKSAPSAASSASSSGLLFIAGIGVIIVIAASFMRRRGKGRKISGTTGHTVPLARDAQAGPTVQRFCSVCGGQTKPGMAYCTNCGTALSRS